MWWRFATPLLSSLVCRELRSQLVEFFKPGRGNVRSLGVYEVNAVDISGRYVKAKLDLSETSSIASVLTTQFEWQTLGGQTPTGHKPNLRGYLGDRAALKDKSQMYELYLHPVGEGGRGRTPAGLRAQALQAAGDQQCGG